MLQYWSLLVTEIFLRWLQGKTLPRINDSISSMTAGIMLDVVSVLIGAFDITSYIWVHQHFCLVNLAWDSPVTWWLAFVMIDFGYYWCHRMCHGTYLTNRNSKVKMYINSHELLRLRNYYVSNFSCLVFHVFMLLLSVVLCCFPEVNLFWMGHQAHHSSEDFTLSTAFRQSILQLTWVRYNKCVVTNY